MLKRLSLKFKLIAILLLIGLLPAIVIALMAYQRAEDSIRQEVYSGLEAFSAIADDRLEEYFKGLQELAQVLARTRDIYQSLNILAEVNYQVNHPNWQERLPIVNTLTQAVMSIQGFPLLYMTNVQGVIVYSTDAGFMGQNISDRPYIQAAIRGQMDWSELFYSNVTNTNVLAVSVPIRSEGATGNVVGTFSLTIFDDQIANIIHASLEELGQSADAYLISDTGLLYTDTRLGEYARGAALNRRVDTRATGILGPAIRRGDYSFHQRDYYLDYLGNSVLGSLEVSVLGNMPVGLVVEIDEAEALQEVFALRTIMITITVVAGVIIALIALFMALSIVRPIIHIAGVVKQVAQNDFTVRAHVATQDEVGQMAEALNETIAKLSETLLTVRMSAESVSQGSSEIATGNQDLSQRTEEQASSLEEVSSTIEEVTSSLENSANNSSQADALAKETLLSVEEGGKVVSEMQTAMREITTGSQEIAEIIKTVNDIAFQTNLLALNASVEAARAGEQGRGFAVVASEVRNLAGRSAESAKEIERLIKDSIGRVERGNDLMKETAEVLEKIVKNTQKITDVIGEIAASLGEQSTAASEIRNAIDELNEVTQQNASLVEQIASSSENLSSQAVELDEQVSSFKLEESTNTRTKSQGAPAQSRSGSVRPVSKKPSPTKQVAKPQSTKQAAPTDDFDFGDDFDKF